MGFIRNELVGEELIEDKMKKHVNVIEKLMNQNDSKTLVIQMLKLKRDVEDFNYRNYGIEPKPINVYIDEMFDNMKENDPSFNLNPKDIENYKKLVAQIMRELPEDFFIK